jgi:ribosomal protein S27AE
LSGQGTCVLCRADAPWYKLGGHKFGRKRVKAPLCGACVAAHPELLPYTCNLTPAEEDVLNRKQQHPWEKRRRICAALLETR